MCANSTVRVWLYGEEAKKSDLYDLPIQAALLDLSNDQSDEPVKPQHAQISPNGTMLLVVVGGKCKLFTMGGFRHVWSIEPPDGPTTIYATFVDDYCIIIWNKRGQGFLHRIPKSVLSLLEADKMKIKIMGDDPTERQHGAEYVELVLVKYNNSYLNFQ